MFFTCLLLLGIVYTWTAYVERLNYSEKTKDLLIAGIAFVIFAVITGLFY